MNWSKRFENYVSIKLWSKEVLDQMKILCWYACYLWQANKTYNYVLKQQTTKNVFFEMLSRSQGIQSHKSIASKLIKCTRSEFASISENRFRKWTTSLHSKSNVQQVRETFHMQKQNRSYNERFPWNAIYPKLIWMTWYKLEFANHISLFHTFSHPPSNCQFRQEGDQTYKRWPASVLPWNEFFKYKRNSRLCMNQ